jgi:uncharacterized protein (TIGR02147 family)
MKPITEYVDYRRYMQDFYDERKRTSAFTWREFARLAGFVSPTYLKLVCEGKTRLKNDGVERTALAMRLVGYEVDYFRMMVKYAHAKTDYERKKAYDEMLSIAGEHKVKVVDEDAFAYFETWKNPVIRELAPIMPGAKPGDIAKLCCQGVSAGDVRESLDFMTKAGLLKKDRNGNYRQTEKSVSMGPVDAVPVAAREMQRQMGEFAVKALDLPLSERDMSGLTLGLTRQAYEKIRKEIAEFRRRVVAIATEDDETEQVYRMNLQLFPLSERLEKRFKNKGVGRDEK